MAAGFKTFVYTERFERDMKRLDAEQREEVRACIRDLLAEIIPESRRFHCVQAKRPKIFSADVYRGATSYKMTMEIEGSQLILRRVDTHKAIDRKP